MDKKITHICPNCNAKTEITAENGEIIVGKTIFDGEYQDIRDKKIEELSKRIEKLTELLAQKQANIRRGTGRRPGNAWPKGRSGNPQGRPRKDRTGKQKSEDKDKNDWFNY